MPKTKAESQPMLLNWPPSRGPMPNWMSAPNRYDIPAVKIERIEGVALPIKLTKDDLIVSGSWCMSYHVSTVASLTPDQAIVLLKGDAPLPSTLFDPPARTFVLDIGYNHYLSKGVTARATIKPYRLWYPQDKEWSYPRPGRWLPAMANCRCVQKAMERTQEVESVGSRCQRFALRGNSIQAQRADC